MKLSNLFNKTKNNNTTASVQKLEKNQLSKVIGGIDTAIDTAIAERSINESGIAASPAGQKGKAK